MNSLLGYPLSDGSMLSQFVVCLPINSMHMGRVRTSIFYWETIFYGSILSQVAICFSINSMHTWSKPVVSLHSSSVEESIQHISWFKVSQSAYGGWTPKQAYGHVRKFFTVTSMARLGMRHQNNSNPNQG